MGKKSKARAKTSARERVLSEAPTLSEADKEDELGKAYIEGLLNEDVLQDLDQLARDLSIGGLAESNSAQRSAVEEKRAAEEARRINERIREQKVLKAKAEAAEQMSTAENPDLSNVHVDASAKSRGHAKVAAKIAGGKFVTMDEWTSVQAALREAHEQVKELTMQKQELMSMSTKLSERLSALGASPEGSPSGLRAQSKSPALSFAKKSSSSGRRPPAADKERGSSSSLMRGTSSNEGTPSVATSNMAEASFTSSGSKSRSLTKRSTGKGSFKSTSFGRKSKGPAQQLRHAASSSFKRTAARASPSGDAPADQLSDINAQVMAKLQATSVLFSAAETPVDFEGGSMGPAC